MYLKKVIHLGEMCKTILSSNQERKQCSKLHGRPLPAEGAEPNPNPIVLHSVGVGGGNEAEELMDSSLYITKTGRWSSPRVPVFPVTYYYKH